MKQMLRKRELVEAVKVPKSTVADWIIEFHMFIPTTKDGSVTYYRPQAIPVLLEIKRLRELSYAKQEIMHELARKFPLTVEESAANEIATTLQAEDVITRLARGISSTREIVERQSALLQRHHLRFESQQRQMEQHEQTIHMHEQKFQDQESKILGHEQSIEDHEQMLSEIKKELDEVKTELAEAKQKLLQKKKRWWRLF